MRKNMILSVASVLTMAAVSVPMNSIAAETETLEPICSDFIKSDVNGSVNISIPEGASADVEISYSSPEFSAHEYYNASITGGKVYAFTAEGRDTTEDDFRNYTVKITVTGGTFGIKAAPFTDTFTIPDGNDNPDSFRNLEYVFTIDDDNSSNDWDITDESENSKSIALHLNGFVLGDVDGNGAIDSSDASNVLAEYAALQTGKPSVLNAKKRKAADVNMDEKVDSSDASSILKYYAAIQTGQQPSWN